MNNPEAAKNILSGKSCYDCKFFHKDKCRYRDIPLDLICDLWKDPKDTRLNVKWTKESEIDMKAYLDLNIEEELTKLAQEEYKGDI